MLHKTDKNRHLKYWHTGLIISILIFLTILIAFIGNEINNEQKTKNYISSIYNNHQQITDLNTIKFKLVKSQDYLLKYATNSNVKNIEEFFKVLGQIQQDLDTIYYKKKPLILGTNIPEHQRTQDDSISLSINNLKDTLDIASKEVFHKLLKKKIKTNKKSQRLKFEKLGIKTSISTSIEIDTLKKEGLFKRLGKAISNTRDVQKEKVIHTVIVEYDNNKIIGTLEEQFKTLLNKVNKYYQKEIYKINKNYNSISNKKKDLLNINIRIQKISKNLLEKYEDSLREQEKLLHKKYNLQYIKNRKLRFYSLLALAIISIITTIILFFVTRQTYKYEAYLLNASKTINTNLELKNKIISVISHDIRAPLKIISLYLKNLISTEDNKQKIDIYNTISYTSNSAFLLCNRMLEYLKTEKVKMKDNPVNIDLHNEINAIINSFTPFANLRNNKLKNNNRVAENTIVYFDKQQIQRIYFNLLSNAVKYTKDGIIEIISSYTKLEENKLRFDLTIIDNGKGIAQNRLDNIFTPFEQSTPTSIDNSPVGVGLGLFLCKKIVEYHNGKINITSKENKGTKIHLYLILSEKQ